MKKIYAIAALFAEEMETLEARQETYLMENQPDASIFDDDDNDDSRPYQVINGIALYDIKGKMMSSGNFFTRIFGIPTYDALGDVIGQLAMDDEVDQVLMSVNTPGGHVAGLSDLSESWRRLNAVKPITVHTSGMLASAGVWLAVNSTNIYASEVAEVGSIGVILQHVSQKGALDKAGIKVTEIKSSPKKAIGSPAKDLTAEEREILQTQVEEKAELFKKQVYIGRPSISAEAFSGEMFSASKSLSYGLIDGVKTFSQVFEQLSATGSDNDNAYGGMRMKRKMTEAMANAAISAGADPEMIEIVSQEVYDALAPEEKVSAEEILENEETADDVEGSEGSEASEEEEGDETPDYEAQVVALTASIGEKDAQIEQLTEQLAALNVQLEGNTNSVGKFRMIAEERIANMRVAFGLTKMDLSEFSAESVLVEYEALSKQWAKTFKVGGITKPSDGKPADPAVAKITSLDVARNKSVGIK